MFLAQFLQQVSYRLRSSSVHVVETSVNAGNGLLEVLLLPGEVFREHAVECRRGILFVATCEIFKLRPALSGDGYGFHTGTLGGDLGGVNRSVYDRLANTRRGDGPSGGM